ncbi:hypothetical protein E6P78_08735 [Streptomyces sp. A0958]|uniref:hypothetical protein n=1 Tax=Streptomyces sp. A0958 TaxID=2563101 RepID=UPI00109E5C16|nr:hypothetical protein [Streptomyces sp. A0958]THA70660.1 hypothetical protein E6P78_08735 [Streptomyces sp. A0958]
MTRLRTTAVAFAVAVTLVLAGCARSKDGDAAPTSPASPSAPLVKVPAASSQPLDADAHVPRPRQVDEHDAGAVALAWAELSYGYDTAYDAHPHAARLRAARYLTPEKADLAKSYSPVSGPGAQWNAWASHRAWTEAHAALADPDEDAEPDTATRAHRAVSVDGTAHGRDGWKGPGPRLHAYLTLARTGKDAPWRIRETDIVEAATPPTDRP